MIIFINYNNKKEQIKIHEYSSIYNLKQKIFKKLKITNKDEIFIIFSNKKLTKEYDNRPLDLIGIREGSELNINGKLKGGVNWPFVFAIIGMVILVFYLFPLLLISGILPFLLYVIELFVFKIIYFVLNKIFLLPRIQQFRFIISIIIKLILLFFKSFFLYFALEAAFKFVYFCWISLLRGGKNIFTTNRSYCRMMATVRTCALISTIFYLVIYGVFKLPNILFLSIGNFLFLTDKIRMGIFFRNVLGLEKLQNNAKNLSYTKKWKPFEAIPVFGQMMMAYFQALEFGINTVQAFLSKFVKIGCNEEDTNLVSIAKNISPSQLNKTMDKAINKTINNKIKELKARDTFEMEDDPFKLIPCCTESRFQFLHTTFRMILNNKFIMGKLKENGLDGYFRIITYSFNTQEVNLGIQRFYDSFLIFKLLDFNIKAVAAMIFRTVLCNIFYIAQFTSNVLFSIGTPADIADTIKCGMFSGAVTLIPYIIILIVLIFVRAFS